MVSGLENLVAADIFNEGRSFWNIPLIQSLFSSEESELILAMPFRRFGRYDMLEFFYGWVIGEICLSSISY